MIVGRTMLFLSVAASISVSALAQAPTTLDLKTAMALAQEAMTECRAAGFHVTVTVVDAGNFPRAILRDDGAPLITLEVSKMKATSVILMGRPSGPPPDLAPGTPVPIPGIPGTTYGMGGVPLKIKNQLVGAIAVSGAPGGEKDAACANGALAKLLPNSK